MTGAASTAPFSIKVTMSWITKGSNVVDDVVIDKLSVQDADLAGQLRAVEAEFEAAGSTEVRSGLLQAVYEYRRSHYRLGRALYAYKTKITFRQDQGWTRVAQLVAASLGVDVRTVFRRIAEYAQVAELPVATITALENASVDPAARKNADLVDRVAELTSPDSTEDEAKAAVAQAKVETAANRPRRQAKQKRPPKNRIDAAVEFLSSLFRGVDAETWQQELQSVMKRLEDRFTSKPAEPPAIIQKPDTAGRLIYEPRGRAREYAALALNLYSGCSHGCTYCFAPSATFKQREAFSHTTLRAGNILAKLEREAASMPPSDPILMSFTTDPYQPLDETEQLTRKAIQIFHKHGHHVHILTKGGSRALRDLDLMTPQDVFGSTLTCLDESASALWEPGAASPENRIETLQKFHAAGVPCWASLEPVIDPNVTLEIIKRTHEFVNLFKVGKLNYNSHAKSIDWSKFAHDAVELFASFGAKYLIKNDLKFYLTDTETIDGK
jgi:DNA repair photolyase